MKRKSREAKIAKDFIQNIAGLMQMIEICSLDTIVYFLRFQSKIVYLLFIT